MTSDTAHKCGSDRNYVPPLAFMDRLLADYATLALRPPTNLSPDQRRSLTFYQAELSLLARTAGPQQIPIRVGDWLQTLVDLEAFIAQENRWPRHNNRLHKDEISQEERRLVVWVRAQRTAADQCRRCEYQLRRLACIPGFRRRPLHDRWNERVVEYRGFVGVYRQAPLLRSDNFVERSLAAWASKQRLAYTNGRLDSWRIETLERLVHWGWG